MCRIDSERLVRCCAFFPGQNAGFTDSGGGATVIRNPKKQLRECVSEWVMKSYGYKRTVLDMWKNPEEPHGLDPRASTSIFGKGVGNEVGRIHQTIRA
eukprot:5599368-Pyramimonas_sp.AAC.1